MHDAAYEWVRKFATDASVRVLDIGGRDVNGTVRDLFPNATVYMVVDRYPGENVDVVADAATWKPDRKYDVVVCTEVFEHTPDWASICAIAYEALRPWGEFVATMAGPGRGVHSGIHAVAELQDGEHYENIDPADLEAVLREVGFVNVLVDQLDLDVRCLAMRLR